MATKCHVEPSIPFLPPELERKIFEVAVESLSINLPPSRSALSLQLVAKRVQLWLRPLLYSVFKYVKEKDIPFPNFKANPALKVEEIGPFIKHLLYVYNPEHDAEGAVEMLSHCPFVENVAIWIDPIACGNINGIKHSFHHLKRLSIRLSSFTHSQLRSSFMMGLTHLEIVGHLTWDKWDVIPELKNLTHLSTSTAGYNSADSLSTMRLLTKICAPDGCSKLQAFKIHGPLSLDFFDVRIVLLPVKIYSVEESVVDWLNSANGKPDYWDFASKIVHARKKGYMLHLPVPNEIVDPASFNYLKQLSLEGQLWWQNCEL